MKVRKPRNLENNFRAWVFKTFNTTKLLMKKPPLLLTLTVTPIPFSIIEKKYEGIHSR